MVNLVINEAGNDKIQIYRYLSINLALSQQWVQSKGNAIQTPDAKVRTKDRAKPTQ